MHRDLIYLRILGKAKMQALMILPPLMHSSILDAYLGYPSCRDANYRTDSVTVGCCSFKVEFQPVVAIPDIVVKSIGAIF